MHFPLLARDKVNGLFIDLLRDQYHNLCALGFQVLTQVCQHNFITSTRVSICLLLGGGTIPPTHNAF